MKIVFTPTAWRQYVEWQQDNRRLLKRVNDLIRDITRGDEGGLGKPELLHGDLAGFSSRRINDEHRLVYMVTDSELHIVACRHHYGR